MKMLSMVIAMVVAVSCTTIPVGPNKPLDLNVVLADANGQPCNDHLASIKLLRADSPTATRGQMIEVAEVPAPSLTGFDENGQPYTVRFANIPSGSMAEGQPYYFFVVLIDGAANESTPNPPSDDVVADRTPPSAVGQPVIVTVE